MGVRDWFGGESERDQLQEALTATQRSLTEATRELESVGYTMLNYAAGLPQEMKHEKRVDWARKSRVAWMSDPMAGASVDLMNDFCFGRGVPKPRAKDPEVQTVIDEFWDDPDNARVLTSYQAQVALGVDMACQSNIFVLMFDDGADGKVKLALLNHDEVTDAVTDPDNRQRVLYYVASHKKVEWDFKTDAPKIDAAALAIPKKLYYEHWQVAAEMEEDEDKKPEKPPKDKQGAGKVYHIRDNRTTEMIFGVPRMQRVLRWFNAYNRFMSSRVDMTEAAAAFVMKRKAKASPNQLAKIGSKAISRASDLAGTTGTGGDYAQLPPTPGAIINENENLTHEAFKIPSGAGEASQDALMLRSQVSASVRFPQHYLGDAGSANLATATAMELPVLKAVEARQELFEQLFRWAIDRAIERAVDVGNLNREITAEEGEGAPSETTLQPGMMQPGMPQPAMAMQQSYEDQAADETQTERDLTYDFSMPNPLRRLLTDLVSAATSVAQVFDPNNTNPELSRILMTIILGEGFELEDPAAAVELIFPEGYVDPAVAAAQQAAQAQQDMMAQYNGNGGGFGQPPTPGAQMMGGNTAYGAKGGAVPAEQQRAMQQALAVLREGHRLADTSELVKAAVVGRDRGIEEDFGDLESEIATALAELESTNGHQP